ncbi:MAG: transposase [Cellulosilyticaceae bacterium]
MSRNKHAKFVAGESFHVYTRGVNSAKVFFNDENKRYFLAKFSIAIAPYMKVYAYALMGNHFHFLLEPRTLEEIGAKAKIYGKFGFFEKINGDVNLFLEERWKRFLSGYVLAIHREQNRTGPLFEQSFERIHIDSEEYWYNALYYTHHNPIHHHFCKEYNEYVWTSYNNYLSDTSTIVERDFILNLFGTKDNFIASHQAYKDNYKQKEDWNNENDN